VAAVLNNLGAAHRAARRGTPQLAACGCHPRRDRCPRSSRTPPSPGSG
jgi:hypothetical protein